MLFFFDPKRLTKLTSDTYIDTIIIKQSNGTKHTTTIETIVEVKLEVVDMKIERKRKGKKVRK